MEKETKKWRVLAIEALSCGKHLFDVTHALHMLDSWQDLIEHAESEEEERGYKEEIGDLVFKRFDLFYNLLSLEKDSLRNKLDELKAQKLNYIEEEEEDEDE